MTVYTQSVSGALSFYGGQDLYPAEDLYPSDDLYPFGGILVMSVGRALPGGFAATGGLLASAGTRVRSFSAGFAPSVVFVKVTSRRFSASWSGLGAFASHSSATTMKALFGALRASGQLTVARVLPPPRGGGGFATPMGEDFFQRYKPTLRRQKMRA